MSEQQKPRLSKNDPQSYLRTPEQAAKIEPNLPPPGYRREEVLAERKEELEAAKAELESHDTFHAPEIDFTKLEDRDILQMFERNPFSGQNEIYIEGVNTRDYAYKLVLCRTPRSGRDHRMVERAKAFGWEIVTPSTSHMRENGKPVMVGWNLSITDELLNARGVGDTVLMWMPRVKLEALEELGRRHAERRKMGAQATSLFNAQGVVAHTELDDKKGYVGKLLQQGGPVAMGQVPTMAQSFARQQASDEFNKMLQEGRIPGMEIKR